LATWRLQRPVQEQGKAGFPVVRFCSGQPLGWNPNPAKSKGTDLKVGHYTTSEELPTLFKLRKRNIALEPCPAALEQVCIDCHK
jgi:hypothetical protein